MSWVSCRPTEGDGNTSKAAFSPENLLHRGLRTAVHATHRNLEKVPNLSAQVLLQDDKCNFPVARHNAVGVS